VLSVRATNETGEPMSFIVDPTDSTKAISSESGRMAGTVWMAPVGTDPLDAQAWRHIGFAGDPLARPESPYTIKQTFKPRD
jgi:hypothetical protein